MIPEYYEFRAATKILSGGNAIEHLPFELANLGVSRVLVVTDAVVSRLGLVTPVLDALRDSDVAIGAVWEDVPVDSAVEVVNEIAHRYHASECNGIVAVGGGSVLDTAKGAAIVLATGTGDLMDLRGSEVLSNVTLPPLVAIPTTAGTGAEVTGAAVIKDTERDVKMAFVSFDLAPHVAVLDPRMTLELPARITASTAMDALAHSIEAASGRQRNPLSDAYAYAAITLIRDNLAAVIGGATVGAAGEATGAGGPETGGAGGAAVTGRGDRASRAELAAGRLALANAALMAGVAFSNSMVGAVHALGHACGALAHVAHGDAMAILLPHVMEYNLDVCGPAYAELLLPLAGADTYAATPGKARAAAAIESVRRLQRTCAHGGLPLRLSDVGVTATQLQAIATLALNDGSIAMNAKDVPLEAARKILEAAL